MASLKHHFEAAMKKVVTDAFALLNPVPDLAVLRGDEDDDQTRPCIVCEFEPGKEEPIRMGNYFGIARYHVKTNADQQAVDDDRVVAHEANITLLRNAVDLDTLATLLSAAKTEFHCFGVFGFNQASEFDGRSYSYTFAFEAYACTADIS